MATGKKICKICGKEYNYCKTEASKFRYQDVACCIEHASEYFAKIEESRKPKVEESKKEDAEEVLAEVSLWQENVDEHIELNISDDIEEDEFEDEEDDEDDLDEDEEDFDEE